MNVKVMALALWSSRSRRHMKFISISWGFSPSIPSFSVNPKRTLKWDRTRYSIYGDYNPKSADSDIYTTPMDYNPKSVDSDIYNCNLKITRLGRQKKVEEARQVFAEMPHRDIVSYTSMITVYLKIRDLYKAEELFRTMPGRSIVADSAMIDGYVKANRIDDARGIFDRMPDRNVFSWTSLISGYLSIGRIEEARWFFNQMPVRNTVALTTMVLGYARNGLINDARDTFDKMPDKSVVSWTVMIKSYVEDCQIDEARKLFNEMPRRNLYSWNIMVLGYLDAGRVSDAIELFKLMPQRNAISWTTVVAGLAQNGLIENARQYFDQMPKKDIAAWNAMITAYADDGLMSEAEELFNLMPERNIVTWNSIIDGYARNGTKHESLKHLVLMLRAGSRPNEITATSILTACAGVVETVQAHTLIILLGFEDDTLLTNSLVTMYSRSGDIGSAKMAFENLRAKDSVSWSAMILAYSNHGYGRNALEVFARMLRSGARPDEITFVGVLSACNHAGLVDKGLQLFYTISRAYGLEPTAEHYSCIVDLLGRAGKVDEAFSIVSQMPQGKWDGATLGALLSACKLHGNVAVANRVGEALIELEPTSSGGYVLLASVYAAHEKWSDFAIVRKKMKERKVSKVPGFSQIEVKNRTHVFFVGDRSHPQVKEIYALLKEILLPQMIDMGYCKRAPLYLYG
ncbi:pentatricopeptide repeat-containing protein At4g02750-like [Macadamia integrifolia]|uniref:pentatricopeptide repeat-containing protein At4g02750-like n=1 Tax=Macadamia integrifolia TaxID=60698 RepID=UPI001C4EDA38|nr:pentatricopeptide repeat-containing protein At4g02750-like [Macadamia integrifolia]